MDNLMQYIYRRAIEFQGAFYGLYGSNHPGTKPSRLGENHFHFCFLFLITGTDPNIIIEESIGQERDDAGDIQRAESSWQRKEERRKGFSCGSGFPAATLRYISAYRKQSLLLQKSC
jgi:hypothetical protein